MANEALTTDDYASVHRVTELLSVRYLHRMTPNARPESWADPFGMSRDAMADREEWWRFRYPLRVTGDTTTELPPTWSPPPTFIG